MGVHDMPLAARPDVQPRWNWRTSAFWVWFGRLLIVDRRDSVAATSACMGVRVAPSAIVSTSGDGRSGRLFCVSRSQRDENKNNTTSTRTFEPLQNDPGPLQDTGWAHSATPAREQGAACDGDRAVRLSSATSPCAVRTTRNLHRR
jgi:hypothetical protein